MISVIVVDDQPLYRQGMIGALDACEDVELVTSMRSIDDISLSNLGAEIVLLGINLPAIDRIAVIREISALGGKVLVISSVLSSQGVLSALAAGAAGYLTKQSDGEELLRAIRLAARGESYVSPTLASKLVLAAGRTESAVALTKRERQVLGLLAVGQSDSDIAAELLIALPTVRSHLDRIRDKTGARRRAELTNLAHQLGLASLSDADRKSSEINARPSPRGSGDSHGKVMPNAD